MNRALAINAALLAAVAALAAFIYFRPADTPAEYRLAQGTAGAAQSIRIERGGVLLAALERNGDTWRIVAPIAARADALRVQRLLGILEAKAKDRFSATDLARFNLDPPPQQLIIDGRVFGFGGTAPLTPEQYVLAGDAVYLIPFSYAAALPNDALDLASKQLLAPDEAPSALEFPAFRLARRDGKWTMAPASHDMSQDDFNRWLDEWRLASALGVELAGRRKPLATIKLTAKNGKAIELDILAREPELILARRDEKLAYRFVAEAAQRLLAPPAPEK